MPGTLYAPPALETARYCVPLGTCTATTFASTRGDSVVSATIPLIAAVVTPWPDSVGGMQRHTESASRHAAGGRKRASFTRSSPGVSDGALAQTPKGLDTGATVFKGGVELAPECNGGKGGEVGRGRS